MVSGMVVKEVEVWQQAVTEHRVHRLRIASVSNAHSINRTSLRSSVFMQTGFEGWLKARGPSFTEPVISRYDILRDPR